jgi:hypothetical protein
MQCHKLGIAGVAFALLAGCGAQAFVLVDPAYRTERGRSNVVVLGCARSEEMALPTRQVSQLLASELATHWFNVLDPEVLERAHPGLAVQLTQAARQLQAGGRVESAFAERLSREYGIGQLLIVEVVRHEQYWGRLNKITRVGVEARLMHVQDGRTLWQGRYDPELSGDPGHGFDEAARRTAREVVRLLSNGSREFRDTPMANWPILESFTPN